MTIDEAREHVGETLIHRFPGQPDQKAELVKAGNFALHVRLEDTADVVTMHPRHFELAAAAAGEGTR